MRWSITLFSHDRSSTVDTHFSPGRISTVDTHVESRIDTLISTSRNVSSGLKRGTSSSSPGLPIHFHRLPLITSVHVTIFIQIDFAKHIDTNGM